MLAFLLILLPLLVLAWQAWQSLNALSDQAALVNRTTLIDARRSEAMTNAALEMERSYRQYCVLDDPTLAKVYQSQRKRAHTVFTSRHKFRLPLPIESSHPPLLCCPYDTLNSISRFRILPP